jgi:hypothetical protein
MSNSTQVTCPIDTSHAAYRFAWSAADADRASDLPSYACGAYLYECHQCGPFVLSIRDAQALEEPLESASPKLKELRAKLLSNKQKLRALLWEHRAQQLPTPWLQLRSGAYWPVEADRPVARTNIDEFLGRWPLRVTERLDRVLLNLGRGTQTVGQACRLGKRVFGGGQWFSILFAESESEANFYIMALQERGFIRDTPEDEGVIVTAAGWARIEELERTTSSTGNPAFVAMWFGDDQEKETTSFMSGVFNDHIKPPIEKAGYKCDRVDLAPHNDFVMDKVLGMIRVAPFVVADFTGNRNGVYFEAGFARGLGIPVIHTCQEGHFEGAHFDIKQVNTIVWATPEVLGEKLYHRLAGTLGLGPYLSESSA